MSLFIIIIDLLLLFLLGIEVTIGRLFEEL